MAEDDEAQIRERDEGETVLEKGKGKDMQDMFVRDGMLRARSGEVRKRSGGGAGKRKVQERVSCGRWVWGGKAKETGRKMGRERGIIE